MTLSIAQRAERQGRSHWSWSLELAGPAEELDRVDWVEYTLHPTFSPPVHRVADRATSFRLDGSGWGEFMVHALVREGDGRTISLQHWLELDSNARPTGDAAPSTPGLMRQAPPAPAPVGRSAPVPPAAAGPGSPLTGETTAPRRSLYLSSGLADRPVAALLRDALAAAGVEVLTGDDVPAPGDSIEAVLRGHIAAADGVIFIISARESPWARQELAVAREMSVPLAIVRAGTTRSAASEMETSAVMSASIPATGASPDNLRPVVEWASTLPLRNRRPGSRG